MENFEWQTTLCKQIAEDESFTIKKWGNELVFTDYSVYSPHSKNSYKVAIRSAVYERYCFFKAKNRLTQLHIPILSSCS